MGMTTSPKNAEDMMELCAILFGADFLETHSVTTGNSPLVWDETMLGAMRAFCKRNQPVLCSPFVLGGANTPASVPATVAQLNAEALSALAYTKVIRKGCPAIYGHYQSTVSMKSGAPMAGTPEISLMNFMIGKMARFHDVPWRTPNMLGGSKTFDAQAQYPSGQGDRDYECLGRGAHVPRRHRCRTGHFHASIGTDLWQIPQHIAPALLHGLAVGTRSPIVDTDRRIGNRGRTCLRISKHRPFHPRLPRNLRGHSVRATRTDQLAPIRCLISNC